MAITDYPLTSRFNEVDSFHKTPHKGLDIALPLYTPVEALNNAVVVYVGTNDILGNHTRLQLNDGKIIVYGHLAEFKVKEDQMVFKGEVIGLSGGQPGMQGAGKSNGAHLHLTLIENGVPVNPEHYLFDQQDISSPLIFPLMIILVLIGIWKAKRFLFYGLGIFAVLLVIFIAS